MAKTICEIADVGFDMVDMDWPLYRGVVAQEVRVPLSLAKYVQLKQAFKRAKGVVSIKIQCTNASGERGAGATREIKGVRVLELVKASDLTCFMRLADARIDLGQFISVSNINLKFRDGYVDGTKADTVRAALEMICRRARHLFNDDAFAKIPDRKVPDDLLLAGAAKPHTLEYLLSRFGVDLTCDWRTGKLYFATRGDLLNGSPIKQTYMPWVRGKVPGWITEARNQYRLPKKTRYYYKRRHMFLVPIRGYQSGAMTGRPRDNPLSVEAEQVYIDETLEHGVLTQPELLEKYAGSSTAADDSLIGQVIMSDNLDYPDGSKSPISRDGSEERNRLARILKRDWGKLYRLTYTGDKGAWGGWTDLKIGVFATTPDTTPPERTDNVIESGVRGEWAEFLRVIWGGGPASIANHLIAQNHLRVPPLPVMPFDGKWHNEADGIVRLEQQPLPDGNVAMPGRISNIEELRIRIEKRPVVVDGDKVIYSRWQCIVPTWDKAKISVEQTRYLIVIGTRRWPNDEGQFRMYEFEAFPDGNVPFQEFEVPELPALYDFVDSTGDIDGTVHAAVDAQGFGKQLNDPQCLEDAKTRHEVYMEMHKRQFEGEGVCAGIRGLDERVDGAIDQIILNFDGALITTTIRCGNLSDEDARRERARVRQASRDADAGGKKVKAA